jgi:predicted enzyme related to lactoylglutathione lyase
MKTNLRAMRTKIEAVHPVLMVRDVGAAVRFYARLGFALTFADGPDPKYAAVRRDDVELHLQWHDAHEWTYPNDRPTYRFVVADVDALSRELDDEGGTFDRTEVRDTPWGTREFHVRDPDLNGLHFYRDRELEPKEEGRPSLT